MSMSAGDRHWLNEERLRVYPKLFLLLFLALGLVWILLSENGVDPRGKPLGYDFITFWGASHLALDGNPAAAYDPQTIYAAEQLAVPDNPSMFLWHYPPTFYLVVWPLALLPYFIAYFVFIGLTFLLYVAVVRRIAPYPDARVLMLALAFPGVMINLFHGQNAFLTAALIGGALHFLPTRPALAGTLIGLLSIKPHLGVLLPLVLVATRQWRAVFSAALTVLVFAAASWAIVGQEAWLAFWNNLPLVRLLLEEGALPWGKMPTVFAFLRILGVSAASAYLAHFLVAALAAGAVVWVWLKTEVPALRNAALVSGTLLISPYLFDYDLVWLGLAITWLGMEAWRTGFFGGEREVLAAAWLLPFVMASIANATFIQVTPFVIAAILCCVFLRALRLSRECIGG
ncbi:glycosyltransferase family 87 protein [Azotobacter salinestris]|uniref:glycosyltransferase family 87 protein n=1 Tax=Azotobacter salinestris TaxID=69964 RepID=UPI0032DE575D